MLSSSRIGDVVVGLGRSRNRHGVDPGKLGGTTLARITGTATGRRTGRTSVQGRRHAHVPSMVRSSVKLRRQSNTPCPHRSTHVAHLFVGAQDLRGDIDAGARQCFVDAGHTAGPVAMHMQKPRKRTLLRARKPPENSPQTPSPGGRCSGSACRPPHARCWPAPRWWIRRMCGRPAPLSKRVKRRIRTAWPLPSARRENTIDCRAMQVGPVECLCQGVDVDTHCRATH